MLAPAQPRCTSFSQPPVVNQGLAPLEVRDLTVVYDQSPVLSGVSFSLTPGSMTAVIGPNGAGKSTLLRSCLGLVPVSKGQSIFFGVPFTKIRRQVAFMPQREAVDWNFPIRVLDVVVMGLYRRIGWLRRIRRHDLEAARAALEQVGLAEYAARQIGELSGGQQKRVFLARALVQRAKLVILDEPFAGVDAVSESIIARELGKMRESGTTVLLVHHDLLAVRRFCDECLLLNKRVLAHGSVNEVVNSRQIADAFGGIVPLALLNEDEGLPASGMSN